MGTLGPSTYLHGQEVFPIRQDAVRVHMLLVPDSREWGVQNLLLSSMGYKLQNTLFSRLCPSTPPAFPKAICPGLRGLTVEPIYSQSARMTTGMTSFPPTPHPDLYRLHTHSRAQEVTSISFVVSTAV